jgi:membrane protein
MARAETASRGTAIRRGLRRRKAPESPTDLSRRSWWGVAKRTVREFRDDGLTDWAAALTYYAILSIFPALIVLVSILGLIGPSATQPLIDNLEAVAPGPAQEIFTNAIRDLQKSQGAAGVLLVVGLLGAVWSASGYIGAFTKAANKVWDVEEGRPVWHTIPLRIGLTVLLLLLTVVTSVAVVLSGGLAEQAGTLLGVGDTAVMVWNIAKWPVIVLLVGLTFSILYYVTPNVRQPGFRWVTPGGLLAVLLWILASLAFALYLANFGSYNKTYGTLGGVIAFMVWLWITNIVVLLGAELDAELERGREIEAGQSEDEEPFLPPRRAPEDDGS